MALKYCCYFLEFRNFTIYSDQKPIVAVIQSKADCDNVRQARQLAYICEFITDIRYLPDTSNVEADALSHQEINALFQHSIQIDWKIWPKLRPRTKSYYTFSAPTTHSRLSKSQFL